MKKTLIKEIAFISPTVKSRVRNDMVYWFDQTMCICVIKCAICHHYDTNQCDSLGAPRQTHRNLSREDFVSRNPHLFFDHLNQESPHQIYLLSFLMSESSVCVCVCIYIECLSPQWVARVRVPCVLAGGGGGGGSPIDCCISIMKSSFIFVKNM